VWLRCGGWDEVGVWGEVRVVEMWASSAKVKLTCL